MRNRGIGRVKMFASEAIYGEARHMPSRLGMLLGRG
jgi:hypothetical protein